MSIAPERRTRRIGQWVPTGPPWVRCAGTDPDALFVQGKAQRAAKVVCQGCPVVAECLADALDNRTEFGVWGGMTERERRALLRRRPDVRSWTELLAQAKVGPPRVRSPDRPPAAPGGADHPCSHAWLPLQPADRSAPRVPAVAPASAVVRVVGVRPAQPAASAAPTSRSPSRSWMSVALAGTVDIGTPGWPADEPAHVTARAGGRGSARSACRRSSAGGEAGAGRRPASASAASSSCSAAAAPGCRSALARPSACMRLTTTPASGIPSLVEPVDEVGRLAQRVALGGGDDDEGRRGLLEQGVGDVGALAEAAEHRVERRDEGLHVGEQLAAEDLGSGRAVTRSTPTLKTLR